MYEERRIEVYTILTLLQGSDLKYQLSEECSGRGVYNDLHLKSMFCCYLITILNLCFSYYFISYCYTEKFLDGHELILNIMNKRRKNKKYQFIIRPATSNKCGPASPALDPKPSNSLMGTEEVRVLPSLAPLSSSFSCSFLY